MPDDCHSRLRNESSETGAMATTATLHSVPLKAGHSQEDTPWHVCVNSAGRRLVKIEFTTARRDSLNTRL